MFLRQDFQRGFVKFCGFQAGKIGKGFFESTLIITDNHKTQDNFIHAGVMATMSDHTAGYAAYTVAPAGKRILTIEFKINFMRPAFGESLLCRSEVISQGARIIVCRSTVFDIRERKEKMVSMSTITLMVIDGEQFNAEGARARVEQ